jgi:phosphate:Na+ symporter
MGQNIGTCITTLISAIGAKKNAKRAAFIHLYFNMIGTVVFMAAFYIINAVIGFSFFDERANAVGIAIVHSTFNIVTTILWIPFNKVLVKLATMTVAGTDESDESEYTKELGMLDERFLERPAFAVAQTVTVSNRMAQLTDQCLSMAASTLLKYDADAMAKVIALETAIDKYEDRLGTYLVKLSGKPLNSEDSETVSRIFQCISNFERISDHARNISECSEDIYEKKLKFSDKAETEITTYLNAVSAIVSLTLDAYISNDIEKAKRIEPFEEAIDILNAKAKKHHIKRLQKGKCNIENSVVIEDLYINLERVADHCSNVGATMIQVNEDDSLENHVYKDSFRSKDTPEFEFAVSEYSKQYSI